MLPYVSIQPALSDPGFWDPKPSVTWKATVKPGPYSDFLTCAATWGDYVFVAGDRNITGKNTNFVIYKLKKSTGELVQTWQLNPTSEMDRIYDCIVVNDYLYVVGAAKTGVMSTYELYFLKLDPNDLNNYIKKTWDLDWLYDDIPYYISTDGNYIYISGSLLAAYVSFAVKLDLDLNIIKTFRYGLTNNFYAIGVNPKTNNIWIVADTYLAILDSNLEAVLQGVELPEYPPSWFYASIAFDASGAGYIAAGNNILKYDSYLNFIKQVSLPARVSKLIAVYDYIYASCESTLYVLNRELQVITTLALDGFNFRGTSFDGVSLYLAGWKSISGDDIDWVIYRIEPLMSRIHLIVRGMDDGIYYRWMTSSWSSWVKLPGSTVDAPAAAEGGGKLFLAVRGRNNGIWLASIQLPTGDFLGWQGLPGSTPSRPAIAINTIDNKAY